MTVCMISPRSASPHACVLMQRNVMFRRRRNPASQGFDINEDEWKVIEESREDPQLQDGLEITKVYRHLQGRALKVYAVNPLWWGCTI